MGQSRGLLIEGSSTNLLAGSATIGGAYWGVVNATAQQNTAVAPDGTLTATTLVENSAGGAKYAYSNNYTPAGSTTYTFSAFVKPNGRNFCMIYTNLGGASQSSMFDLVTGSTSNLSGSGTNQATQCGNGWWRLSVTVTTSSTTTANFQILPATDATTFDYTGNGYSGLICWGAMLEQSSFASSYIGTTSSAVTRASDSASVDLSAINQDPIGTDIALATEFRCNVVDTNFRRIAEMRRSSGSGLHKSHQVYNGTAYSYATDTSGTNQVLKSIVSLGDSSHKLVSTQSGASAFAAGDGVAGNTKTSTAEDMVYDRLYIGSDGAGVRQLDGHISRIALYGNSISETNATALSS